MELLRLSSELIRELNAVDEYVMGMPMHNWGPPSIFKLWVDHIVTRASIRQKPLNGKRSTFIIAAGKSYGAGSADAPKNFLVPWLRSLFESLGLGEMQFIVADGTRRIYTGDIDRENFLAEHVEVIRRLFLDGSRSSKMKFEMK